MKDEYLVSIWYDPYFHIDAAKPISIPKIIIDADKTIINRGSVKHKSKKHRYMKNDA